MGDLPRKVAIRWKRDRRDETGRQYLVLRVTWPSGQVEDRGVGYRTPEEAERDRGRVLLGHDASASSGSGSVADVLAHYVADVEERYPDTKYATNVAIHGDHLARHLGRKRLDAITTRALSAYVLARGREETRRRKGPSLATRFEELRVLLAAMRVAVEDGLSHVAPPPLPRRKDFEADARPPRCLSDDEVARLTAAAYGWPGRADGEVLGCVVSVLAWQGRRPVAVWGLRYVDCRELPTRLYWERDKGGVGRGWSPVSAGARTALARLLERRPGIGARPLFSGDWDQPLTTEQWGKYWMPALSEAAGVPDVTAYDLRRHACTRVVEGLRGNLKAAMLYTGHTKVETLLRYVFGSEAEAREAADRIGPRALGGGDDASDE